MRRLELSADQVGKLLRQKRVWLLEPGPQQVLRRGALLRMGDLVEVRPAETGERPPPQPNRKLRLKLVHEDADLVVVDKPPGRVVHPGPQHGTDSLLNGLVAAYPELVALGEERGYGLVHRLDRDTSGLLVVARSAAAYDHLRAAFSAREVSKRYWGLVKGLPPEREGRVEGEIEGREATSRYELVETRGAVSLVRLFPETGRTHQLRIHMASIGCPILADPRHGHGLDEVTARLFLKRQALHAEALSLVSPSGERLSWESEAPRDLRKAWKRAEG